MVGDGDAIMESSVGKLTIPRFVGPLQSQRQPRNLIQQQQQQDVTTGWLTTASMQGHKVNITMESMSQHINNAERSMSQSHNARNQSLDNGGDQVVTIELRS
jgi:hypothetical protein